MSNTEVNDVKATQKKAQALGMPFGTASNRLRKSILFHLLREAGKNVCFRCGEQIGDERSLSIEHKTDWLNSNDPAGLFFDIENIAFSHLSCNSGARSNPLTKDWPEGMAWCKSCQSFKPADEFPASKFSGTRDGRKGRCKSCSRAGHH